MDPTYISPNQELQKKPSERLGEPLPPCVHAVSVSLPLWDHVVGYEEGRQEILSSLRSGYPRFVLSRLVEDLMLACIMKFGTSDEEENHCLVLPSSTAAEDCQQFILRYCELTPLAESGGRQVNVRVVDTKAAGVHAVFYPAWAPELKAVAKAYWQHTGRLVSSRRAFVALHELGEAVTHQPCSASCRGSDHDRLGGAVARLCQRIAIFAGVGEQQVRVHPSGMAAIYSAYRLALNLHPGLPCVVFGWPYLDTLKLLQRPEIGAGCHFFGRGDHNDLQDLQKLLESGQKIAAVFTEFPSNPLLTVPPLHKLRDLADKYGFMLIVDDTISNWLNVDLLADGTADIVVSSLTKLFSGKCNVIGGSLIFSNNFHEILTTKEPGGNGSKHALDESLCLKESTMEPVDDDSGGCELFPEDAEALLANCSDFEHRNRVINRTTYKLVDWLKDQPEIESVFYPGLAPSSEGYKKFIRSTSKRPIGIVSKNTGFSGNWLMQYLFVIPSFIVRVFQLFRRKVFYSDAKGQRDSITQPPLEQCWNSSESSASQAFGGLFSLVLKEGYSPEVFYNSLKVCKGPSLGTNFTLACPYTLLAHFNELEFAKQHGVQPGLIRISVGLEPFEDIKSRVRVSLTAIQEDKKRSNLSNK